MLKQQSQTQNTSFFCCSPFTMSNQTVREADSELLSPSTSHLRPITTGDIGLAPTIARARFRERSGNSLICTLGVDTNRSRPRAVHTQQLSLEQSGDGSKRGRRRRETEESTLHDVELKKSGSKKAPLSELWASLRHFERNNPSRSLTEEAPSAIHFVNIEDSESFESSNSTRTLANIHPGMSDIKPKLSKQLSEEYGLIRREKEQTLSCHLQMQSNSVFTTPMQPRGRILRVDILSNWGDPFLVGLTAMELFDSNGHLVHVRNIQARPTGLSAISADFAQDPRTADKLIDGVTRTADDLHVWLAPFTFGSECNLCLDLDDDLSLSALNIWNYNTSRVHASRGVRYIEIFLDSLCIFKGELQRATGSQRAKDMESNCTRIVFTKNERILALVRKYDLAQRDQNYQTYSIDNFGDVQASRVKLGSQLQDFTPLQRRVQASEGKNDCGEASWTDFWPSHRLNLHDQDREMARPSTAAVVAAQRPLLTHILELIIHSNWGDMSEVGLCKVCGLNAEMHEVCLPIPDIFFTRIDENGRQKDLIPLYLTQAEIESVVIDSNGRGLSIQRPQLSFCVMLRFSFQIPIHLKGLKVWNIDGDPESACKGAKHVSLIVDGITVSETVVRKAPGQCLSSFDFSQFLAFSAVPSKHNPLTVVQSNNRSRQQFLCIPEDDLLNNKTISRFEEGSSMCLPHDDNRNHDSDDELAQSISSFNHYGFSSTPATCMVGQQYETPVSTKTISLNTFLVSTDLVDSGPSNREYVKTCNWEYSW
jgi:hypothetical protein